MKKILLVMALLSILLLGGCSENQNLIKGDLVDNKRQEENVENGQNEENAENGQNEGNAENNQNEENVENNQDEITENEVVFSYTSLDDLKRQNLIPSEVNIGEEHDVGSLKLGNTMYAVKYVKEIVADLEAENGISEQEKLRFYKDDVKKLELIIGTEEWINNEPVGYIKEISTFKDKYLVTNYDSNASSWESLMIYDEELNLVTNYVDTESIASSDSISVERRYDNCYVITDDKITCICNSLPDYMKVTYTVSEENGVFKIDVIEKTAEDYKETAGAC